MGTYWGPNPPLKGSDREGVQQLGAHHLKFTTNCPFRIAPAEVKGTTWLDTSQLYKRLGVDDLDEEGVYNTGMYYKYNVYIYMYTYLHMYVCMCWY